MTLFKKRILNIIKVWKINEYLIFFFQLILFDGYLFLKMIRFVLIIIFCPQGYFNIHKNHIFLNDKSIKVSQKIHHFYLNTYLSAVEVKH